MPLAQRCLWGIRYTARKIARQTELTLVSLISELNDR